LCPYPRKSIWSIKLWPRQLLYVKKSALSADHENKYLLTFSHFPIRKRCECGEAAIFFLAQQASRSGSKIEGIQTFSGTRALPPPPHASPPHSYPGLEVGHFGAKESGRRLRNEQTRMKDFETERKKGAAVTKERLAAQAKLRIEKIEEDALAREWAEAQRKVSQAIGGLGKKTKKTQNVIIIQVYNISKQ